MEKVTKYMRDIINAYYSKPKEMSTKEFCSSKKIKVYQLDRMLELYGQKLMPGLVDLTKRNLAIYTYQSQETLNQLWRESSKLIAVQVSDREKNALRRNDCIATDFEHIRFRLLIDVAMMSSSWDAEQAFYRAHREVLAAYDF